MQIRYLVLTGCPRSGTSVLKKVLRGHREITTCGVEHGYILELYDRFGTTLPSVNEALDFLASSRWWFDEDFGVRLRSYLGEVRTNSPIDIQDFLLASHRLAGGEDGKVMLLQYPGPGVLRHQEVQMLLGGCDFLVLLRDPRANVSSQISTFGSRRSLIRSIRLWKSCARAGSELQASASTHGVEIRYDELVHDPRLVLQGAIEALGLAWDESMMSFEIEMPVFETDSSSNQRRYSSFDPSLEGKWRDRLSPAQLWLVERLCKQEMRRYGFPTASGGLRAAWLPELAKESVELIAARFRAASR